MLIVHLGGGELGERIGRVLEKHLDEGDRILAPADKDESYAAFDKQPDWIVSAGWRYVLTADQLAMAGDACNVHPAYLPWGRGANPNVWALLDGEPAGVSIHRMTAGLDKGPLFARRKVPVSFGDTAETLYARLMAKSEALFAKTWPEIKAGHAPTTEQEPGGSYHRTADMLEARDIDLDEQITWRQALNTLRAFTFPPHRNIVVAAGGRQWHVEVTITNVTSTCGGAPTE